MKWPHTPVRTLVLLLCCTEERRRAREHEALALADRVHGDSLLALLERLNVLALVGQRMLALGAEVTPAVVSRIESFTQTARQYGTYFELTTLGILAALERAGIRTLPLKGSTLARQLYGDTALRSSVDIDVLVGPHDLREAINVLQGMGWELKEDVSRDAGLPVLHETLVHSTLPRVELHWRVHWYEARFASEALARAERPRAGEPLRMQPSDEFASLILFYARDGFSGLRTPADIASWWSARGAEARSESPLGAVTQPYPALAAPLQAGSVLLEALVGVPARRPQQLPFRCRLGAELADPFLAGGPTQLRANASLVDLVLAPPRGRVASMRREFRKIPAHRHDLARRGPLWLCIARTEHALRVLRRWGLGALRAFARLAIRGGLR